MTLEQKTILIVDDSLLIRQRLSLLLHNLQAKILLSCGFSEAVDILNSKDVDIVLIDIHLQDRNGIDLLRLVKQQFPHIFVMIVTNQANMQTEMLCKSIGANHFIDKSNDFARIPAIISSQLP